MNLAKVDAHVMKPVKTNDTQTEEDIKYRKPGKDLHKRLALHSEWLTGQRLGTAEEKGERFRVKPGETFEGIDFRGYSLEKTALTHIEGNSTPVGGIFTDCNFENVNMNGVRAENTTFDGCILLGVTTDDGEFLNAKLPGSTYDRKKFRTRQGLHSVPATGEAGAAEKLKSAAPKKDGESFAGLLERFLPVAVESPVDKPNPLAVAVSVIPSPEETAVRPAAAEHEIRAEALRDNDEPESTGFYAPRMMLEEGDDPDLELQRLLDEIEAQETVQETARKKAQETAQETIKKSAGKSARKTTARSRPMPMPVENFDFEPEIF